jgi:bacillithiol system protein YtxJ
MAAGGGAIAVAGAHPRGRALTLGGGAGYLPLIGDTVSTIIALQEKTLPASCLVFKHSTACGVSARAAKEVEALQTDLPIYWVNVREQRDLSNWIAETYHVTHESPQLILLSDGKAAKTWNHFQVNREVIEKALVSENQ